METEEQDVTVHHSAILRIEPLSCRSHSASLPARSRLFLVKRVSGVRPARLAAEIVHSPSTPILPNEHPKDDTPRVSEPAC